MRYSLEPTPTRQELQHAARLVLAKMKADGYRTQEQTAKAIGIPSSDLNRLLNAKVERKWGYWRLKKFSLWLGVSIDGLLGRKEGTTRVLESSSPPLPLADVEQSEVLRLADQIASEKLNLRLRILETLTRKGDPKEAADYLVSLMSAYAMRIAALQKQAKPKKGGT